MKNKVSTVLKAFITGAWTLLTGQASTTLTKEYFILYWNCVFLDCFALHYIIRNFGKRYIQRFPSGHKSPLAAKEKSSLLWTKKLNKMRYHISKQKPLSIAFPLGFLQLIFPEVIGILLGQWLSIPWQNLWQNTKIHEISTMGMD